MKRIIVVLLVLIGFTSQAQWPGPYTPFKSVYEFMNNTKFSHPSWFTDSALFTGPTRVPTMVSTDSSNRAASTAFVKRNFSSLPGCINGLEPGTGLVTQVGTSTTFNYTPANYIVNCTRFITSSGSIVITAVGDTSRVDVIYVDTSGTVKKKTGVESLSPALPALTEFELALSYIFVSPDSIYIGVPTANPLWVQAGNNIMNANSGNVGIGGAANGVKFLVNGNSYIGTSPGQFAQIGSFRAGVGGILMTDLPSSNHTVDSMVVWNPANGAFGKRPIPSGTYTLPTASSSVLGGVKVGTGLSIDGSGVLSSTGAIPNLQQVTDAGNLITDGTDSVTITQGLMTFFGGGTYSGLSKNGLTFTDSDGSSAQVQRGSLQAVGVNGNINYISGDGYNLSDNVNHSVSILQNTSAVTSGNYSLLLPDKYDLTGTREETIATKSDITDSLNALRDSSKNATFDSTQFNVTTTGGEVNVSLKKEFKSYVAVLNQTGTDDPLASVNYSDLGDSVVWTRLSTGVYKGTCAAITGGKYYTPQQFGFNSNVYYKVSFYDGYVIVETYSIIEDEQVYFDDSLADFMLKFEIY